MNLRFLSIYSLWTIHVIAKLLLHFIITFYYHTFVDVSILCKVAALFKHFTKSVSLSTIYPARCLTGTCIVCIGFARRNGTSPYKFEKKKSWMPALKYMQVRAIAKRGRYEFPPFFFLFLLFTMSTGTGPGWLCRPKGSALCGVQAQLGDGPRIHGSGVAGYGTITGPCVFMCYKNEFHKWNS